MNIPSLHLHQNLLVTRRIGNEFFIPLEINTATGSQNFDTFKIGLTYDVNQKHIPNKSRTNLELDYNSWTIYP